MSLDPSPRREAADQLVRTFGKPGEHPKVDLNKAPRRRFCCGVNCLGRIARDPARPFTGFVASARANFPATGRPVDGLQQGTLSHPAAHGNAGMIWCRPSPCFGSCPTLRHAAHHAQVGEQLDDVVCIEPACHSDRQCFAREFVDHAQDPELARIAGPVCDEVVGPDLIGALRPQPDARTIRSPEPVTFRLLAGTLSPSRRQIRSTRLRLTGQPAWRSSAVIRR
jgi:hypothetical protein